MADLIDPFMTFFREFPGMDRGDSRAEAIALDQRQATIEQWLLGELPEDAVLETLLDQGISPDDYAHVVTANVDYVIDSGIRFQSNDSGLFLPVH